MPKIIDDVRGQLLCEARRQLSERGYSALTIRSIASSCRIAVGTVYNYFPSKESLIAQILLTDWTDVMKEIVSASEAETDPDAFFRVIYQAVQTFGREHTGLFSDELAKKEFPAAAMQYHSRLRGSISTPICEFLTRRGCENPEFSADFLAESLLCWTNTGVPYETLSPLLLKLL
ncbi:MAG: TetR/AcrR family transcriptional regulator [Clostridia bacterium]|nr:TetR/AcrR family transcriptional regulator [Clostridia bacterium]